MSKHTSKTLKTRSIQLRIGLLIISLTTLVLVVFGIYQYYEIYTRKTTELRVVTDNAADKLAKSLVTPLWNYAWQETDQIILSEMRDLNIYAVLIRKVADDSISTGKVRDEDWQIINTTDEVEGEFIVARKAVIRDEETLATVEVYVTQRFLQEELTRGMIGIVVIVLVLDTSIFIVLVFALRIMLLRPINKLLILANGIAAGNFDQNIEIRQRDEIGTLAEAFQTMQTTIGHVLQDLQVLIEAIQNGKLTTRGTTAGYAGKWSALIESVNNLIDVVVAPISETAAALDRIAKGDIPDRLTADYRGDFNRIIGNLNELIDTMQQITGLAEDISLGNMAVEVRKRSEHDRLMSALENMIAGMKEIARSAEEMSNGNLMVSLEERSAQDTLMQALNTMIQHVKLAVINVRDTANTMANVSQQLSSGAEQLSNGAAEQAASMEESSSSMEEMAANIRQNADNARQTEKIAVQSAEYAEEAGRVVAETVVAMQQIAQKIAIIEDIANQTRMLSLNATIEAARAQEHGKAFSVVASEIRQLSDTTKKAAEEINQLATSSLNVSEKAGTMLATLVPSIRKTTELILEISAASNEQSTGAEQINRAIQQADQITQQNATIAEETAASAEELSNQAQQLQHTIAFFTIDGSFQEQESKGTHQKLAGRSGKSKKQARTSKSQMNAEETEPAPDASPAISASDDVDEYDEEFERY